MRPVARTTGRHCSGTMVLTEAAGQRRVRERLRACGLRCVRVVVVRACVVDVLGAVVRVRGRARRPRVAVRDRRGTMGGVPLAADEVGAESGGSRMTCMCGWPCSCGGRAVSSVPVKWTTTGFAPTKVRTASTWKHWAFFGSSHQRRTVAPTVMARSRAKASKCTVFLVRI